MFLILRSCDEISLVTYSMSESLLYMKICVKISVCSLLIENETKRFSVKLLRKELYKDKLHLTTEFYSYLEHKSAHHGCIYLIKNTVKTDQYYYRLK